MRGVAARLLRARGYEVLEASDGETALAIAQAHAGKIDLMICDVIMPGIDGPTLLKQARGYLGAAPVMFISGYADTTGIDPTAASNYKHPSAAPASPRTTY